MSAEAIHFNTEELTLLYRVARTLLGERDYGELLAGLLDVTIEGLAADRGLDGGGILDALKKSVSGVSVVSVVAVVSGPETRGEETGQNVRFGPTPRVPR